MLWPIRTHEDKQHQRPPSLPCPPSPRHVDSNDDDFFIHYDVNNCYWSDVYWILDRTNLATQPSSLRVPKEELVPSRAAIDLIVAGGVTNDDDDDDDDDGGGVHKAGSVSSQANMSSYFFVDFFFNILFKEFLYIFIASLPPSLPSCLPVNIMTKQRISFLPAFLPLLRHVACNNGEISNWPTPPPPSPEVIVLFHELNR